MDQVKFTSKFMTGLIGKIVDKKIQKAVGDGINVKIGSIDIRHPEEVGMITVHVDGDIQLTEKRLQELASLMLS